MPSQNFAPYWDPGFAEELESWGEGNAWKEIQLLMSGCSGNILDIACGTGKVMEILGKFPGIDLYGCDISDFLIRRAAHRGIPEQRLCICDATSLPYHDLSFDFVYSIGSFEHFTEDGLVKCISESYRISRSRAFHMVPVSRTGLDEGWKTTVQSFHNNSVSWWEGHFSQKYETIIVLDSAWEDSLSVGKWFVCIK